jgi:hypothetical protein
MESANITLNTLLMLPNTRSVVSVSIPASEALTVTNPRLGAAPTGFTYDGAASMSMLVGELESAVGFLTSFISSSLVHASTMYSEGGNPCIESPLAAASSLQDFLLVSAAKCRTAYHTHNKNQFEPIILSAQHLRV